MASLLSKLSSKTKSVAIEPREIFMALPKKDKRYEYPRDVQSEVWKKWFDVRDEKNCIIKMNTGSGKTVVGLMILQSCLNEGKGPAVYVVPDKYLVGQVCNEAKNLGILVTDDKDSYYYTENKAILVTTVYSLINGRSAFGMRQTNNYPIGSVLLDDVHACLDTITTQFSIRIPASHALYQQIVKLFASEWKSYNNSTYINIIDNCDPTKTAIIPFWVWQDKKNAVYELLSKYNNADDGNKCVYFNLPLIEDTFSTCDCFISSRGIEIIPEGVSISKITSFVNAQRRIFMSATLADDSVFISAVGLHRDDIKRIIVPDNANDIGDRLFLFPRHLNSEIKNEEIRDKLFLISQKHNVVVIVPSFERAEFWDPHVERTVTKDTIDAVVAKLKATHLGLVVMVNRYDGVDLPDNACRVLVIDGLPPLRNEKDKYIQSINPSSRILVKEQIQRIEQGMGRGVRSNSDSCCIVLMGDNLADVLLRNNGVSLFSTATKEQYSLSKDLWDLLIQENPKPSVDDVFALADYSLNREIEWIQTSKECLSEAVYSSEPQFDSNTIALRNAYDYAALLQWQKAIDVIDSEINNETDSNTKGYLLQLKAKYMNFIDRLNAQQILLAGRRFNMSILAPINGIRYDKSINNVGQAKAICDYIDEEKISQNNYVIHVNSITSSLTFSPDASGFESALQKIGKLIGFASTRPDKETNGEGPDNLWAIGDNNYLVIECKSGATSSTISKEYCNQLGGSMRWFASEYGDAYNAKPIIVHQSLVIDRQATALNDMRIINQEMIEKLKKSIDDFAIAIAQDVNWHDERNINELLHQYGLRGGDIVNNYTYPYQEA